MGLFADTLDDFEECIRAYPGMYRDAYQASQIMMQAS